MENENPAAAVAAASPIAELVGAVVPPATPEDKRITGERNTLTVLNWLHRFGWLTSRMLAALVWPKAAEGLTMTRRTLKRLQEDKLILCRGVSQGVSVYLLSVKGARFLNDATGTEATSGQSLATGNAIHRACSNWYLIEQLQEGLSVLTEHEIASARKTVHVFEGKQPDGLVLHDGGLATWLEVENAWKNRSRRQAVVDLATRHLGRERLTALDAAESLYLARLAVVATGADALRHMAASFMASHRLNIAGEGCLAAVDVSILPVSPSLAPSERYSGNLWWDVVAPALKQNEHISAGTRENGTTT